MDILDCLANLSNDEVFTSPAIANRMLDTLPEALWSDPNAKFLDPFTKSGVFLREIAKRLMQGLATAIPDRQARLDHILGQQLYGIAITQLTALTARRTLYCNKDTTELAHCLTDIFAQQGNPDGNIYFEPCEHTFVKGKCTYCGATEREFGAEQRTALEQHAYLFIHNKNPYKEMQFDVIIGNPPYQMSDGGGTGDSAQPIYQLFIEQAIKLAPKYLCMIVPSRWMKGGKGLDRFRKTMMEDKRVKFLYDFESAKDIFPGITLDGGVCYFLWDKHYNGKCEFHYKGIDGVEIPSTKRFLSSNFSETIIRDFRQASIIEKVYEETKFSSIVFSRNPYGISADFFNSPEKYENINKSEIPKENYLKLYGVKGNKGGAKRISVFIERGEFLKNESLLNKYKLFFSKAYTTTATVPPKIIIGYFNEVCTETFLNIGAFDSLTEAKNCLAYIKTKFFRALLFFNRSSLNISKETFNLIPLQDFTEEWTDEKLYKKYGLTSEEIAYIEEKIDVME